MVRRRLGSLALVAAAVGLVLLVVALSDGADGSSSGGDGDGWIIGLLLTSGPLGCAAGVRVVVSSKLRRPVGVPLTVVCFLLALLHVGVLVDDRGAVGWLFGLPTALTPVLLTAALVARDDDRVHRHQARRPDHTGISGPPLDVLTPLRDARAHASRAVLAWVVVLVVGAAIAVPVLRLFSWPRVESTFEARVVDIEPAADDESRVSFEGSDGLRIVRWEMVIDGTHHWRIDDRRTVHLDDEGRVHFDQQFGLAGIPLFMPPLLIGWFTLFAVRRLWGILVAIADARAGNDEPWFGYAAVIHDPAPRTIRPLVAVWTHDPTDNDGRLPKPDRVYRADEETGEHLESYVSSLVVREAWIDSGVWSRAKPRWIGFDDGVAVPHRRAVLGRLYLRAVTKRADVTSVVPLRRRPPVPGEPAAVGRVAEHRLGPMVAWRLISLVLAFGATFLAGIEHGGHHAELRRAERPTRLPSLSRKNAITSSWPAGPNRPSASWKMT